jgi:hypothetical protein
MKQNLANLKHREGVTFRWDKKGVNLIKRRAKTRKMSQSQYLRYCVERESE